MNDGPLAGIRVLELGSFIAGPSTCRILAEFGAEVIKIERPGRGDEIRQWRSPGQSSSLLWQFIARNKRCVTLDLTRSEGRDIALGLAEQCDIVVENFRPGTLERWRLSPDELRANNPDLIVVRISGYGQTGPYRSRPGFGGVAEALGGVRYLTGYPGQAPSRVGVPLADCLAGLYGVIGALMGLVERGRGVRRGETVDVALYEAVFAITETLVSEYSAYGDIRQRTGSSMPGVVPSNIYPCRGGSWIVIGGNADGPFHRLMVAIGREDLANDPTLVTNDGRVSRTEEIDDAISTWASEHDVDDVIAALDAAGCPAGPIYSAADILADPHFAERGMLLEHQATVRDGTQQTVAFPGIVPKLAEHPGEVTTLGPPLGADTGPVLKELLHLDDEAVNHLRSEGIV